MSHQFTPEQVDRFWKSADTANPDACWMWQKSILQSGYGNLGLSGKNYRAHRVAWMITHGSIPEGQVVCHRCDTPACINPSHLFLGTQGDNIRDAQTKGRLVVPGGKGVPPANATLNHQLADEIRRRHDLGEKKKDLAINFGVSRRTINAIVRGEIWKSHG